MNQSNTLDRAIFGVPVGGHDIRLLAHSEGVSLENALIWREHAAIHPYPVEQTYGSQAVGIFKTPTDDYVLARAQYQDGDLSRPAQELVRLRRQDLQAVSGNLRLLIELVDDPLPSFSEANTLVEPLVLAPLPTSTLDKRLLAISALMSEYGEGDIQPVLALLAAALDGPGLEIRGYVPELSRRLDLIQGLMMLLPSVMRPELTFATHAQDADTLRAQVVFTDAPEDVLSSSTRHLLDSANARFPNLDTLRNPYIDCLDAVWEGDIKTFMAELRAMELMTIHVDTSGGIRSLDAIAQRYIQDKRVRNDQRVPIEQLKDALTQPPLPTGELYHKYVEQLLNHALEIRDPEAVRIVTQAMDGDPEVNAVLDQRLNDALETQPDAVYFCVRERLRDGIDPRWLPRLSTAAEYSLWVAVHDGDTDTLVNWLKLITREPVEYGLDDVLQQGILAAQERARSDGALGYQLLRFAARRAPQTLTMLLDDAALMAVLPDAALRALAEHEPEAMASLQSREIFLVALARAAADEQGWAAFTEDAVRRLWDFYTEAPTSASVDLPAPFDAGSVLDRLINEGLPHIADDTLYALLGFALSAAPPQDSSALSRKLIPEAAARSINRLAAVIGDALPPDALPRLLTGLTGSAALDAQQAADLSVQLLRDGLWAEPLLPLAEQLARSLQQNPALAVERDVNWQLISVAEHSDADAMARAMTRRVLADIERHDDETRLIDDMLRLSERITWSPGSQAALMHWWRDFARQQPLSRLQQFEKLLSGIKGVDSVLAVVETALALRRVLGKRSLEDFADAVGTAYRLLQSLSEAFDPLGKTAARQPLRFDTDTIRSELDERQEELTPDERKVLAKNLKELGSLIASMAEYRSKASLIRRGGEVERKLIEGDQLPQSAIDTLKWLSGYLDGVHRDEEAENGGG